MKNLFTWMLLSISSEIVGQVNLKATIQTSPFEKIDMVHIKNQSYLKYSKHTNCDSTSGTSMAMRICANLELQKQDSLLQIELKSLLLEKAQDTTAIKRILNSQEIWERFRYAQCVDLVLDKGSLDAIIFMQCASELTVKRRQEIKNH